jgi:hypothetical protein
METSALLAVHAGDSSRISGNGVQIGVEHLLRTEPDALHNIVHVDLSQIFFTASCDRGSHLRNGNLQHRHLIDGPLPSISPA